MKGLLCAASILVFLVVSIPSELVAREVSGTVVQVNHEAATLTVRDGGRTVTFDAANPTLRGYRSLASVRRGDRVSVAYTATGIRISRGSGRSRSEEPKPAVKRASSAKSKEGRVRLAERRLGDGFTEVDENRDGRISPVELSVVMPGLTMEQFKAFDRNGDGFLDRSEYKAVRTHPAKP